MKKENLKTLIDVLKKSNTFDMSTFYREKCGSPACIAGHVKDIANELWHRSYGDSVKDFLGITEEQAEIIIKPEFKYANYKYTGASWEETITKSHAIRMLERLLETGLVDWKGTKEEPVKEKPKKFDMKSWLAKIKPEEAKDYENV